MIAVYNAVDKLTEELTRSGFNAVVFGTISDADIERQTLYPLANIQIQSVQFQRGGAILTLNVMGADVVDDKSLDESTKFKTDNRLDIFHNIATKFSEVFSRYSRNTDILQYVDDTISLEPFEARFENVLAGYEVLLTLQLENDQESAC